MEDSVSGKAPILRAPCYASPLDPIDPGCVEGLEPGFSFCNRNDLFVIAALF